MPPRRRRSERGSLRSGGGQWLDGFDPQRISIPRTDKWRAQKSAYIQERKDQLKEMFQQDLENDDRALKRDWVEKRGVVNSTSPNPYLGPSIFDSRSMDGSHGYVLSDISKYLKANLRPSLLEDIKGHVKDKAWIDKELGGFGDDNLTPEPKSGLYSLNAISKNKDFIAQHGDPDLWHQVTWACKFLKKIRIMRRLVDNRNQGLDMNETPSPNGLNIQNRHLRTSWILHRAWIRALHYRGLSIGAEKHGVEQMEHIMLLSLGFLALECDNWGFEPIVNQQNPLEFATLGIFYEQIQNALENLGTKLVTETRPPLTTGAYTLDDTVAYHLLPERFTQMFRKHFGSFGNEWILWASLSEAADKFERYMDLEHVEDVLINKRIVYDDEWSQIFDLLTDEDYVPDVFDLPAIADVGSDPLPGMESNLRKIAQINRLRQSYLVLRDWMKRRPWKQIYYTYDTRSGAEEHYLPYIRAFYDSLNRLKAEFPMPEKQHIPTNKGNMFSCLSPVHPIAITELPDFLTRYDDKCSICIETWVESPHTFIVEQHCGHCAHYSCLREHWDDPDAITLRCPLCRSQNHPWGLHEITDITPEVLDVWDYEHVYPPDGSETRTNDRISEYYHGEEDALMSASLIFSRERGYNPRTPNFQDLQERVPYTEMVTPRYIRRMKNEHRRNMFRHLGKSIHELDPNFERPPHPGSFLP